MTDSLINMKILLENYMINFIKFKILIIFLNSSQNLRYNGVTNRLPLLQVIIQIKWTKKHIKKNCQEEHYYRSVVELWKSYKNG